MSLRINTNIPAMTALRNLSLTDQETNIVTQRLSSGLRINSAADDPAGLIISEGMRSQIKGVDQAMRNSQDAVNMAKTAEAAMDEVQTLLRNIRGLAVHSANSAVIDSAQLQANQTQIRSVIDSINRIAEQTQWGNKKLLDGTAGVLANVTAPADVASIFVGGTFNGQAVANGPVTMQQVTSATRATITLGNSFASANAIVTTAGAFVINGYSFTTDGTETVGSLVSKINSMTQTTGVTANLTGAGPVSIVLSAADFGSKFGVTFFDPNQIIHNATSASATGVDAVFNITMTTAAGVTSALFTGGMGPHDSGLKLTGADGNSLLLTQQGNTGYAAPGTVGQITAGSVRFQIGANANQSVSYAMPTLFANRLGTGAVMGQDLSTVDVTTSAGAQNAIKIIDAAVTQLAQIRGDLGSFQSNFLESTVRSLSVAKENLTASESQIRDADMAEEITNYTRLQILKQSGMSVLAQTNQAPQSVLSLLRGQ